MANFHSGGGHQWSPTGTVLGLTLFNIFLNAVKQRVGGEATKFAENTGLFRVGKLKANNEGLHKNLLKLNGWTSKLNVEKCTIRKMKEKYWYITEQFYLTLSFRIKILGR